MTETRKTFISGSEEMKMTHQPMFANVCKDDATNNNNKKDTDKINNGLQNCYEVFRNNTTAVEVVVKEVPPKKKKTCLVGAVNHVNTIILLQDEVCNLKRELNQSDHKIEAIKYNFIKILTEVKRQRDVAYENEQKAETKNAYLQLENEKLKALVEMKETMINKFRREQTNMKKMIKCVIKGIVSAPEVRDNITYISDSDYEEFKKDLTKKANPDSYDVGVTFENTFKNWSTKM